jgi:hypothetical protein
MLLEPTMSIKTDSDVTVAVALTVHAEKGGLKS